MALICIISICPYNCKGGDLKINDNTIMKLSLISSEYIRQLPIDNIVFPKTTTNTYQSCLKQLHNNIHSAYNAVFSTSNISTIHLHIQPIHSPSDIPHPSTFDIHNDIPIPISTAIKRNSAYTVSYTFTIHSQLVTVYFILEKHASDEVANIKNNILRIQLWLHIAHQLKPCSTTLRIFIYLMSIPKLFPSSPTTTLDAVHVNSAFTRSCHSSNNEIVIFRSEEWFKVLIHETFHHYGFDFSTNHDRIDAQVKQLFGGKLISTINLYEAYCEFWAEYLNVCIGSYFLTKNDTNRQQVFVELVKLFMTYEIQFSYYQQACILSHMKIDNYTSIWSTLKYKERTNVFSYYIIKLLFMQQYPTFVVMCSKYGNTSRIFQFHDTEKNQQSIYQFIVANYKRNSHIHNSQVAENIVQSTNALFLRSLRMSICDFHGGRSPP